MKETKFYKKEFHIIAIIFLAYLAICGIVSLYYLITGQGGVLEEGQYTQNPLRIMVAKIMGERLVSQTTLLHP